MQNTISRDRHGVQIAPLDTVAFSDGSTVQVLAAAAGSIVYQRDGADPVFCYSFLVEVRKPPASSVVAAVVAPATDVQGVSLDTCPFCGIKAETVCDAAPPSYCEQAIESCFSHV